MRKLPTTLLFVLIAGFIFSVTKMNGASVGVEEHSLEQLEQRLAEIDARLDEVAQLSLRSGSGMIGYRSRTSPNRDRQEWIEIQLKEPRLIEEVVLVPTLSRSAQSDFKADAFPQELRIWAGTDEDRQGRLVGSFRADSGSLPRIAPLALQTEAITATWVQIEATKLSPRDFDENFCLQLSEVLVFSGDENIALHRPVSTSSFPRETSTVWSQECLTDGHTPYLMDAAQGNHSIAFLGSHTEAPSLIIDLESPHPLSQVNFHTMETSDTVPTALADNYGMPDHIKIEGALQSDFSDATVLLEASKRPLNESGPIWMWRFPETSCRYLRISVSPPELKDPASSSSSNQLIQSVEPDASTSLTTTEKPEIGFAEIEVISKGSNVAINKRFKGLNITTNRKRDIAALTDGRNFYGTILPIREWMSQLAERHDLEFERNEVATEINRRYTKQKQTLRNLIWLAALLAAGIFIIIYVNRLMYRRQLAKVKQRFAADLHDEIGANLHTINLTTQLIAKRSDQLPKEVNQLTTRIQTVIERTSHAIRYVADIQTSAAEPYVFLPDDLRRTAERILIGIQHQIEVEGAENLRKLDPRRNNDLVLLYQECLINICRHANATKVVTSLVANSTDIQLTITDNGKGLPQDATPVPPPSLTRRAKLLRASIQVESPQTGGTTVTVKLRRRNRLLRVFSPKSR